MWRCVALSLLLVTLCCGDASTQPPPDMDKDTDVCAMTEVLMAMNKLLVLLSKEISDLRTQVRDSCQSSGTAAAVNDTSCPTVVEPVDIDESPESKDTTTPAATDIDDVVEDLEKEFTVDVEDDYEEYDDDVEPEENPVSEVVDGLSNWWNTFSIFPPEPSTDQPDDADEDIEEEEEEEEEEEQEDIDEDADDYTDETTLAPKPTTTTSTTTTTTTTTPVPYTLPPPPTSCMQPFILMGEGCYMVVRNYREWRSWGDAFAYCLNYGGQLAAPRRFPQFQNYLTRHYSDAFWVGARLITAKRKWEWLTDRKVEKDEWRQGQPNRHPGKKCVFLDSWSGYHANNFFCGEKHPFICESAHN